jgi:hypothetical protein
MIEKIRPRETRPEIRIPTNPGFFGSRILILQKKENKLTINEKNKQQSNFGLSFFSRSYFSFL